MDFKQLQSYCAVVQHKSFTNAAKQLFISQPTISAHVHQLEKNLGTQLIRRTTKSIEITPKGMEVYDYASNILTLCDRMIETCSLDSSRIIRLGASSIPSSYILPEILPEYGKLHPDTFFSIQQKDSQSIVNDLKESLFDVGIIGMEVNDDQIACIPFMRDHVILITPVNEHFLKLQNENATIQDLLREPIITRENGSGSKKAADLFLESIGISEDQLTVVARINDQEAIKKMVAAGLGVSIISEIAAQNLLDEKRILKFELYEYTSGRNLYLIYRKNMITPDYMQNFLRFLKKKSIL